MNVTPRALLPVLGALCLLSLAAIGPAQEVKPDESGKEGEVEVLVLDSFGGPALPHAAVRVERLDRPSEKITARSGSTLRLPYGRYRVSAWNPGFSPAARTVEVSQPRQALVFGLSPSEAGATTPMTVYGSISDLKDRPE